MTFVKAQVGPSNVGDPESMFTVHYFDEHGNLTIRSGGKRAWRCNNPGNFVASPYSISKDRRAIGKAGDGEITYAVYPDYATGHEALVVMLKGSVYSPLTLRAAIRRYDKEGERWIPKMEAINFALEQRLHAVLVCMKKGACYLRPEFGVMRFMKVTK